MPDPVVLEVLSASAASTDRIERNREYQATPSIQRYVMVEQDRIAATVFTRAGQDWVGHVLTGAGAPRLSEIGVKLPLSDLHAGVDPEPDNAAA